jgi:hypothetical protein
MRRFEPIADEERPGALLVVGERARDKLLREGITASASILWAT